MDRLGWTVCNNVECVPVCQAGQCVSVECVPVCQAGQCVSVYCVPVCQAGGYITMGTVSLYVRLNDVLQCGL